MNLRLGPGLTSRCSRSVASVTESMRSGRDASPLDHARRHPKRIIRSKYGEPTEWDGLAAVFVALASVHQTVLNPSEAKWLAAFRSFLSTQ